MLNSIRLTTKGNLMDLTTLDPATIIREEWLRDYQDGLDLIWYELIRINANLFILDRIQKFPFRLFGVEEGRSSFWESTFVNTYDSIIMSLWKITLDTNSNSFTIYKWKNGIKNNLRNGEHRHLISGEIDAASKIKQKEINARITTLRHKVVAHLDKESNLGVSAEVMKERRVYVHELRLLCEDLNKLFGCLCFNHEHGCLPIDYTGLSGDYKYSSDIDRLLERIADDSGVIHIPEEFPDEWPEQRQKYSEGDLEIINHYRSRLGLPPA